MDEQRELYSAAEAAYELGTTSRSLRRVRERLGELGLQVGLRVGKVWAFTEGDIERLRPHVHQERGNPKWIALREIRANQVSRGGQMEICDPAEGSAGQ